MGPPAAGQPLPRGAPYGESWSKHGSRPTSVEPRMGWLDITPVAPRAEVGGVLGPPAVRAPSAGVLRMGSGAVRGGVPPRAYPPWFG